MKVFVEPPCPAPPFRSLDLSPLHARCLLRSDVRKETYECIANELCDYGLSWQGEAVDARAYVAGTGQISIYEIQYGDEVRITPSLYRDFILAHVSLRNGIEVEADGRATHVPEGAVLFSAPRTSVKLRWQAHCRQLLVRIPWGSCGRRAWVRGTRCCRAACWRRPSCRCSLAS